MCQSCKTDNEAVSLAFLLLLLCRLPVDKKNELTPSRWNAAAKTNALEAHNSY